MRLLPDTGKHAVQPAGLTVPGLQGLHVLLYVRHRRVFAQLAARLIGTGRFERVLADLRVFMNEPGWVGLPLALLPDVIPRHFVG